MEDILLSVIVPVYNTEKYLNRCIDSILNQTYKNLEIICVDDGSTDNSGAILDEYARLDRRINVIHQKNAGRVLARTIGLEHSIGRYCTFVDADDLVELQMYEKMISIIKENQVDVVCTGIVRDYGNETFIELSKFEEGLYRDSDSKIEEIKRNLVGTGVSNQYNIGPHLQTKIWKKELIYRYYSALPKGSDIDEDVASVYPALLNADSIFILNKAFYHYMSVETSTINSADVGRIEQLKQTYNYLRSEFEKHIDKYPLIMEQYESLRLNTFLLIAPEEVMKYDGEYLYPFGRIKSGAEIVLYGAGSFGKHLKTYIEKYTDLKIVAWADKSGDGKEIITPDLISDFEYDVILIGVLLAEVADAIYDSLIDMGIPKEKVYRINGYKRSDNLCNGA